MTLDVYNDIDQGASEWHDLRRGMVTASAVGQLISVGSPDALTVECPTCSAKVDGPCLSAARKEPTPIKTIHPERSAKAGNLPPVYSAANNDTSRGLTALLVAERIAGWTDPTWFNDDMARGVDCEPIARDYYSGLHQQAVECGFMVRREDDWTLGYSPDGLVADDGLVEIKSPRSKTHIKTILANEVPAQYMAQCQAGLLVSGRKWLDFVSFCGGLPLFVKRVYPDPKWHEAIVAAVTKFETTAAEMVAAYTQATADMPATERVQELEVSL